MDNKQLLQKTEEYVTGLFDQMSSPSLVFHNLEHTQTVVKRSMEIAEHYGLSDTENQILFMAAWFHDTGHLFTEPAKHEEMSVEIMKKFMNEHQADSAITGEIAACIMATKLPRNPLSLLQQIICDADTYHFGTNEFKASNKNIYKERTLRGGETNPGEFKRGTIRFLETHTFYTSYCQELLNEKKEKNLKKLKSRLANSPEENEEKSIPPTLSNAMKDKSGLMSKGIQTMLRLTSENHLRLSEMADNKANILISVNAIIISVILSVLLRKLQEEVYLVIPTIIFLLVSVTTIVISILATRPKISGGTFTEQEVKQKKVNLLFFGNFHKATYEQYDVAMRDMMLDTDYLYTTLIKDIYFLGKVLGRKYKLIRLAYNVFMIGIVISVLAFTIATFFSGPSTAGTIINGTGSPF